MSMRENSRETGAFPEVLIKGKDPFGLLETNLSFMQSPVDQSPGSRAKSRRFLPLERGAGQALAAGRSPLPL